MRAALLIVALAALSLANGAPAHAEDYPFCIKGDGGPGDCKYVSYEQCLEAISGRGGYCQKDPYFDLRPAAAVSVKPRRR